METYRFAQICINGHIRTDEEMNNTTLLDKFCQQCGKEIISSCQDCKTEIRGRQEVYEPSLLMVSNRPSRLSIFYEKPLYCHNCGKDFPWLESTVNQIIDLVKVENKLSEEDCKQLRNYIVELSKNSSESKIAAIKFNEIISKFKLSSNVKNIMKGIVISIITDVATKKLIGL